MLIAKIKKATPTMSPIEVTMGITMLSGSRPLEKDENAIPTVNAIVVAIATMLAMKKAAMRTVEVDTVVPRTRDAQKIIKLANRYRLPSRPWLDSAHVQRLDQTRAQHAADVVVYAVQR
jgi:hypothetical protein